MKIRNAVLAAAGAAVVAASAAGCGAGYHETHDFNAPDPVQNAHPAWTRVWTPYQYPTLIRTCDGTTGLYVARDDSSATVMYNDPACKK